MAELSGDQLVARRLAAQGLARPAGETAAEVVQRMGAVQAQDPLAAKWAIGARLPRRAAHEKAIDAALADGTILRTHIFRGTWQLVAPVDVRWMLSLVGPRVIARAAGRFRQLGLTEATFRKSRAVLAKRLAGRQHRTREGLAAAYTAARIDPSGQRLPHLLARAELEGLICNGPRQGNQITWALLDEWAPAKGEMPDRKDALGELARRYFTSRGPAGLDDFVWWSGLTVSEARAGLAAAMHDLVADTFRGRTTWRGAQRLHKTATPSVQLLPAFDEYLVAYRRRDAVLAPEHARRLNAGGGMLAPSISIGGKLVGLWRRVLEPRATVRVETELFAAATREERAGLDAAMRRYAEFLGRALRPAAR